MTVADDQSFCGVKGILCAVDLSDFSAPVLAHATALARQFDATVTALHVFAAWMPPPTLATYPAWMTRIPEARDAIGQEVRGLIGPFDSAEVPIAVRTAEGDAAAEIVRSDRHPGGLDCRRHARPQGSIASRSDRSRKKCCAKPAARCSPCRRARLERPTRSDTVRSCVRRTFTIHRTRRSNSRSGWR